MDDFLVRFGASSERTSEASVANEGESNQRYQKIANGWTYRLGPGCFLGFFFFCFLAGDFATTIS